MAGSDKTSRKIGASLGQKLSDARAACRWTQAQLAERVGVDTETISRFERGAALPSLVRLHALAAALGTSAADLISDNDVTPSAEGAMLSAWMSHLHASDRDYLIEQIKRACDHLRNRSPKKK